MAHLPVSLVDLGCGNLLPSSPGFIPAICLKTPHQRGMLFDSRQKTCSAPQVGKGLQPCPLPLAILQGAIDRWGLGRSRHLGRAAFLNIREHRCSTCSRVSSRTWSKDHDC